jgi:hypothetical protein
MKDFLYFESKATLIFKKLVASGVDFDKYKVHVNAFLKYMSSDFKTNLELYKTTFDVESIQLETIISPKYKFLFKGIELRNAVLFLNDLETRIADFKTKETVLKTLVGTYFLYYVVICKLVETYLSALSTYNVVDPHNIKYTLVDIGIDNSILRYYVVFEDLRQKTIDEWLKVSIDAVEERYIASATKRILMILGA